LSRRKFASSEFRLTVVSPMRGFEPLTHALRIRRSLARRIPINMLQTSKAVCPFKSRQISACASTKVATVKASGAASRSRPHLRRPWRHGGSARTAKDFANTSDVPLTGGSSSLHIPSNDRQADGSVVCKSDLLQVLRPVLREGSVSGKGFRTEYDDHGAMTSRHADPTWASVDSNR
jgi:hypothetical protein